jgi:hypothetical protein
MSHSTQYSTRGAAKVPMSQRRAAEIVLDGLTPLERAQVVETMRPEQGFPVFEPLGRALRSAAAGATVHLADRVPRKDADGEAFSDACLYGPLVAEWALSRLTPAQRAEVERADRAERAEQPERNGHGDHTEHVADRVS